MGLTCADIWWFAGEGGYNVSCSLGDVEEIGIHNWRRDKDLPKSRGRGAVNIFKCVTVDLASICIITE